MLTSNPKGAHFALIAAAGWFSSLSKKAGKVVESARN
jgi:hypothetical protein